MRPGGDSVAVGLLLTVAFCGIATAAELAIVNATVFDATGAEPYTATVLIRDGRIAAVDRSGDEPDVPRLDAEGLALLPGLHDLHVHYTPRGTPATTPQVSQAFVAAGVTTVLDFHQAPEAFAPRRQWLAGLPGPHVLMAARLSTPGGHGADWSDTTTTRWVNTPHAATQAVRELVNDYRPDAIKVFADGWRYGSGVDDTSMDEPTLTALVAEAHAHGLKVVTHTVTVARAGVAARAGVDVIVHSILDAPLDAATIADLRQAGTAYAATLAVYNPDKPGMTQAYDSAALAARRSRFEVALGNLRALHAAGVPVVAGTDSGMVRTPHGTSTLDELELMVGAGLEPAEALLTATANAATALGMAAERGTIEVGKAADLLLVRGAPWQDIGALRNVAFTFVGGQQVFGAGAPPAVVATSPPAVVLQRGLIDDFERADGRTSRDTLRVGFPDGGRERSWQIFETRPAPRRGRVLSLSARLAARDDARVGVILPLSPGAVRPVDASAFSGLRFALRSGEPQVRVQVETLSGSFVADRQAAPSWRVVEVPFEDLAGQEGAGPWRADALLDVRLVIERAGGDNAWFEVDEIAFY